MPSESQWQGEPHTLIVHSITRPPAGFDEGEFEYDLEHPPSCKQEVVDAGAQSYTSYTCDVAWLEGDAGMAGALAYSGDSVLEPGTYRIAAWGAKTYYFESGYEYDAGIAILEPEEEVAAHGQG